MTALGRKLRYAPVIRPNLGCLRYEWPFDHGKHTFSVRCYEGNGTPQVATPSPVEPSGATGAL
jgi:hypothetical protein